MELNESFAQVRGQLLLMDPLPPINKVFSLISQEEHQRKLGVTSGSNSANSMAFAVKSNTGQRTGYNKSTGHNLMDNNGRTQRRERPFCTHCNYHGHTVETCYKIHGYPPGFRQKPKSIQNSFPAVVGQVSDHNDAKNKSEGGAGHLENFFQNLNST